MALNINKGGNLGKYYFAEDGVEYGPFELGDLLKYINKDSLIYYEGIKWTQASELPEIGKFFHTEEKVVERVVEKVVNVQDNFEESAAKKNFLIPVLLTIVFLFGLFWVVDYQEQLQKANYLNELKLNTSRRQAEQDSISAFKSLQSASALHDSVNLVYNAKLDSIKSIEQKIGFLQNQASLVEQMERYYSELTQYDFDARDYYADTISQYITLKNISPAVVNSSISNQQDYEDEVYEFNRLSFLFNRYENNVYYFTYSIKFSCYRPRKDKNQTCDIDIEVGFDKNYKIRSYKEIGKRNLTFN